VNKADICNLTLKELEKAVVESGMPRYRAAQIFSWIYCKGARGFEDMHNIPKDIRDRMDSRYSIAALELSDRRGPSDNTEKFLFKLSDGNFVETVLIYSGKRETLCLSTQVGCKYACSFCASGKKGFTRDLRPSEILNQILYIKSVLKHEITNYVFMGMGEPLDNYDNLAKSIKIMNDPRGLAIGARRITVSTCGIVSGIRKLKNLGIQINLSVSLHAANDILRSELMPINRRYPLKELISACKDFLDQNGRMITLEYILIKGKNDSLKDIDELSKIADKLKAKVNIIACMRVPQSDFVSPDTEEIKTFIERLKRRRVNAILRGSRGGDINAACGQLAGKAKG